MREKRPYLMILTVIWLLLLIGLFSVLFWKHYESPELFNTYPEPGQEDLDLYCSVPEHFQECMFQNISQNVINFNYRSLKNLYWSQQLISGFLLLTLIYVVLLFLLLLEPRKKEPEVLTW